MSWVLALVLKPFFAVLFFTAAWLLSRVVWRYMPPGKFKDRLFSPLHRKSGS
jgi:hypothetical protein